MSNKHTNMSSIAIIVVSFLIIFIITLVFMNTNQKPQLEETALKERVSEVKDKIKNSNEPLEISNQVWQELLSPERYEVIAKSGTERPHSSPLNEETREGVFVTAGCKQPVFTSKTKFKSGTGWPSFWAPITKDAIKLVPDWSLGIRRWEVVSSRCNEHLGHVFSDGPESAPDGSPATGLRYCLNGAALEFIPKSVEKLQEEPVRTKDNFKEV